MKLETQSKRLTRKLKALRQEAWRLMHVPLAVQHRWYTSVLLGHYGYYGRPQNFPALIAFRQEVLRIWLTCLRRRSQKTRRMSWQTFAALLTSFPLPTPSDHSSLDGSCSMTQVILGKSRVREICMPGSVRAKAEWLSYSTNSGLLRRVNLTFFYPFSWFFPATADSRHIAAIEVCHKVGSKATKEMSSLINSQKQVPCFDVDQLASVEA